jgi:ferredoxin
MEDTEPLSINTSGVIGLAFPVAYQSTFPFVWDFINRLPEVNGTKIFMVDTLAGFSGAIVGPLKKTLLKKGYEPIGAKEIIMPRNIFCIPPEKSAERIVKKGIKEAEKYGEAIIYGSSRWRRLPVISDIAFLFYKMYCLMIFSGWNQRIFGFKVDTKKCTQCGLCAKLCPVENIQMKPFPVFADKCNFCMRCVSWCPEQAISCKFNYKGRTYRADAINSKELL